MNEALAKAVALASKNQARPTDRRAPLVEGRILHVDGDYLAYYCAGNKETPFYRAKQHTIDRIQTAADFARADKVIVHLSARECNKGKRPLIAFTKPYQGQRNASRKPENFYDLREFLETYDGNLFKTKQWYDREADDGIAYYCETSYRAGHAGAIYTKDKDMRMFCGVHVDWDDYVSIDVPPDTFAMIGPRGKTYGHKWFWTQMLVGDSADNIPGAIGVGDKAVPGLLDSLSSNDEAARVVLSVYKARNMSVEQFAEQAALLWMRREQYALWSEFVHCVIPADLQEEVLEGVRAVSRRVYEKEVAQCGA
jgi:DNA polymerase-1